MSVGKSKRPTVVVVEDDAVQLRLLRRLIAKTGRFGRCYSFADPAKAIRFISTCASSKQEDEIVDLLILDIKTPDMSGFEALRLLQRNIDQSAMPKTVMMTTVSLPDLHLQRATANDIVKAYFRKPLTIHDLDEILSTVAMPEAEPQLR